MKRVLFIVCFLCLDVYANPVVLTFKDSEGQVTTYYKDDVLKYREQVAKEIDPSIPEEEVFVDLRDQLLLDLLIKDESKGLGEDPEVSSDVNIAKREIMKKIWLQRQLNKMIKDEDLVASYDKLKGLMIGKKVYAMEFIIMNDESKAEKVLGQVQSGHDFSVLAKQHSLEKETQGVLAEEQIKAFLGEDGLKRMKILKDGAPCGNIFRRKGLYILVRKVETQEAKLPEYEKMIPELKALEMQKGIGVLALSLFEKKKRDIEIKDFHGNEDTPLKKIQERP